MISSLRVRFADPLAASLAAAGLVVVAGIVAIVLGWRGAAATLNVAEQVPFLVSGGIGGICLVISGMAIFNAQVGRHLAAQERAAVDDVLDAAHAAALRTGLNRDLKSDPGPSSRHGV